MNDKIDVLAVMERTAGLHDSMGNTEFGDRVREARAAVSKLAEAAQIASKVLFDPETYGRENCIHARALLDAALAKFGGAR